MASLSLESQYIRLFFNITLSYCCIYFRVPFFHQVFCYYKSVLPAKTSVSVMYRFYGCVAIETFFFKKEY